MNIADQHFSILPTKRVLLALAGIFVLSGMAHAAQITLAWDKVSGSTVAGYKLYYGTQSAKYTTTVNAGSNQQYTISGLANDTTYYFAAKTYDNAGNESGYSNEVSGKIPTPNSAPETPVLNFSSSSCPVSSTFTVSVSATDPDGDALQYRLDWGDGAVSAWGSASQSHVWSTAGAYCVKGQAKDSAGALSGWSNCNSVTVNSIAPPVDEPPVSEPPVVEPPTSEPPVETPPGDFTPGGDTGSNGIVKFWFEAEDGDIATPMEIASDDAASADGYIWTPNGVGNHLTAEAAAGSVVYHVNVTAAGNYLIWGRVFSPTYADDSFFVSVDGSPYIRWNTQVASDWAWDAVASQDGDDPMVYYLTEGSHSITLLQREDGTQIDRLLVTNDLTYIPEGQGENVEPDPTRIWLESEDGTVASPMQIQSDSAAAGGGYIGVPDSGQNHITPDLAAGYADFVFQVPQAGDYLIWGRVLATSFSNDSFFVSIDDETFIRWNPKVGNAWHWEPVTPDPGSQVLISHLEAGWHTLTLLCREDGTNIDKILITDDRVYSPDGLGEEPTVSTPSGKTVTIEAEKGLLNGSMRVAAETGASAGQYVWVPEGTGNTLTPGSQSGSVAYSFTVGESGSYVVWGRVFSSDYANDSFFVSMDGGTPSRWNTQVASSWTWDQAASDGGADPMIWQLSAGVHTLVLMQREDGTMLDKIVITSDLAAIPN